MVKLKILLYSSGCANSSPFALDLLRIQPAFALLARHDELLDQALPTIVSSLPVCQRFQSCLFVTDAEQNNKDYFDQSLDEIKLLRFANEADPGDEHNLLRLYDYFYYRVRSPLLPCLACVVLQNASSQSKCLRMQEQYRIRHSAKHFDH